MKVIDDFLGYKEFQRLRSEIMSPVFDWNFVPMSDSMKEDQINFLVNLFILHIQIVFQEQHFSIV